MKTSFLLISSYIYIYAFIWFPEYDQWVEDDIKKLDVQQKVDRKKMEGKITVIEDLKKKIKEKEEEQGIVTKTGKDDKAKEKADTKNKEDEDMTAEEKHMADIEAILNLPTYWVPDSYVIKE